MKSGAALIAEERFRQLHHEGFSLNEDQDHIYGELAQAAICYADNAIVESAIEFLRLDPEAHRRVGCPSTWPVGWSVKWWKPKSPLRDLVRAGALIAAEIDRLQELEKRQKGSK